MYECIIADTFQVAAYIEVESAEGYTRNGIGVLRSMGKRARVGIYGLALVTLAAIGYIVLVPAIMTRLYVENLNVRLEPLKKSYESLRVSMELPIVADLNTNSEVRAGDKASIQVMIDDTRHQLSELEDASLAIAVPSYSGLLGRYSEAEDTRRQVESFTRQSRDAISGYETLIRYIGVYGDVVASSMSELDSFNQVVDVNIYEGRSEEILGVAQKIRSEIDTLSATIYPPDMENVHRRTITALSEAAGGFEDLSSGLLLPADELIYSAVRRIESAALELEKTRGVDYYNDLYRSRAVKNVQDLEDKFELLTGV